MSDIIEHRITPIVFEEGFVVERYRTRFFDSTGYSSKEKFDGILIKNTLQWASNKPEFSHLHVFSFRSIADAAQALAKSLDLKSY